jgi:hypothetical protein
VSECFGGMSQFEQRANIKLMFKLEKSAKETLQTLHFAYGDTALTKSAVYEWYLRFKDGQETMEDEPHSRHPSTSRNEENVVKVRTLVRNDVDKCYCCFLRGRFDVFARKC